MVKINFEEKTKCVYGNCFHGNEKHNHGICWEVTQPEEKGLEIYCPCTLQGEKHRLYEDLGYMIPGPQDRMITKPCRSCGKDVMLNLTANFCMGCKSKMGTLK